MIQNGLILTDGAELLSLATEEVKTRAYEESETSLDDTEALAALVPSYRNAQKVTRSC